MKTNVSDTSLNAYFNVIHGGYLGKSQQKIYLLFKKYAFMSKTHDNTNLEISKYSGIPINIITARVNELRKMGLLVLSCKRSCFVSGNTVQAWRIK